MMCGLDLTPQRVSGFVTLSILFLVLLDSTAHVNAAAMSTSTVSSAHAHQDQDHPHPHPHHVPEFTIEELMTGSKDEQLKQVLSSTGLLAVRVENHYGDNLLQGICDCSASSMNHQNTNINSNNAITSPSPFTSIANADEFLLADGKTLRQTIATATLGTDRPLPLPKKDIVHYCYQDDNHDVTNTNNERNLRNYWKLEHARDVVSEVAQGAFLPALDRLLVGDGNGNGNGDGDGDDGRDRDTNVLLKTKNKKEYSTITSIVKDAVNLEHFHAYSHTQSQSLSQTHDEFGNNDETAALDWHTDGGLFLAFLPGTNCQKNDNDNDNTHHNHNAAIDESFRIKIPDSEQDYHPVIFPSTTTSSSTSNDKNYITVAIMLGHGAEHWISSSSSDVTLRATNHAVMMPQNMQTRVWYGMMHLVPTDAIVTNNEDEDEDSNNDDDTGMTFEELKRTSQSIATHGKSRTFGDDASVPNNTIVLGSSVHMETGVKQEGINTSSTTSISPRRRLQHVGGQDDCNNTNNPNTFFCWLSCLSIASDNESDVLSKSIQENVDDGKSLYCIDPTVLFLTKSMEKAIAKCADSLTGEAGGVMDQSCGNYWHDTVDGVQSYTDVFKTEEEDDDEDKDGQNSSSGNAALTDERYCYGATSMYMQGFVWEGSTCVVYLFSPWIITTRAAMAGACIGTILFGIVTEYIIRQRRKILSKKSLTGGKKLATSALMYGLQLTLGYLLMLVVMTYSGPLVMSVVIGIVMGHVIWNWGDVMGTTEKMKKDRKGGDGGRGGSSGNIVLEGSTPCCQNIIDEESDTDDNDNDTKNSKSQTDMGSVCECA